MKRYFCVLVISTLTLAGCTAAAAQQRQSPAGASPAENASLAETLLWLDLELKRYGRFTLHYSLSQPGLRHRTRFLGLEADRCSVTYRVSYERLGPGGEDVLAPAWDEMKPAVDGGSSVVERVVDLTALNPALVRGEKPKKWDGGVVIFGAGRGTVAVRSRDGRGRVREYEGGEFYVSEKGRVEAVAEALRRAVVLCRG